MESMQDLESDDLDLSHECDSFCMTLNKLSKFQEPSISRSVISHNRNDNSHFFFSYSVVVKVILTHCLGKWLLH